LLPAGFKIEDENLVKRTYDAKLASQKKALAAGPLALKKKKFMHIQPMLTTTSELQKRPTTLYGNVIG
jgi:hypothetical protein